MVEAYARPQPAGVLAGGGEDGLAELARTFDTSLSRATHRFENTAHQVGQLEAGQRRLEQTSLQMQAQLRI